MNIPEVSFAHLSRLTTTRGLFEHAQLATPRREHGYCLDDVARGLVVTSRQPDPTDAVRELSRRYLRFTVEAQDARGRARNRRADDGRWTDEAGVGDHWGRAIWGLGTAAAHSDDELVRARARAGVQVALRTRSPWPRAMAYAAIGAYELLTVEPDDSSAQRLLVASRNVLRERSADPLWPWPEPRLTYANAVLPEALIVIGIALDDAECRQHGLDLLTWLLALQTRGSHISVTPAEGWQPDESLPGFDQQPIEVAALAEACRRAFELTGDPSWAFAVDRCAAWFLGWNDVGVAVYDPATGGGYDGLHRDAVNQNQGAESTLAALATFQLAHSSVLEPV